MQKITPFLWFNNNFEEAFAFYKSIFKSAKLIESNPMGGTFELEGQRFSAINGGPMFQFSPAISLYIDCKNQEEVDHYWEKLSANGGEKSQCGWLKDKFGLSWQVIPDALPKYLQSSEEGVSGRVLEAMMKMKKIDIKALDAAAKGK